MMKTYNTDYFYSIDVIYQLSKLSGKPVIHFKVDGKRDDEVWDFYYDKADNTVVSSLRDKGEVYCYFLNKEQAYEAFHDWFPQESDLMDDEKHFYISVHLVDVNSGVDIVNGNQV